ncbi:MAG: D-glycerate dehydrogenase [Candidatus Rokubacteria bacterium]|nr:D-glycerate dehydrogenase [Candidatus Rokubacteria bacterium]
MRPRVFVTQPVAARALDRLRTVADVDGNADPLRILTPPELAAVIRDRDVLFCLVQDTVTAAVIAAAPRLRLIATMTITPEQIDVAAATARRIPVTMIPPMVTEATADLAFALLLAVARRVVEADGLVRAGVFPGAQSHRLEGHAVAGATLGLVGCGRVGQAVARRARGFGMRIVYADPRPLEPAEEAALGAIRAALDDVLAAADFVSVHVPLAPATRHLIGARELERMKPTAYLVNTSRGPIVEEKALVAALAAGRIAGAALDVFEHEPRVAPELLAMPNVVFTPHIGSGEIELRERMAGVVVDNILAVLAGRRPPNCANPEVFG